MKHRPREHSKSAHLLVSNTAPLAVLNTSQISWHLLGTGTGTQQWKKHTHSLTA